MRGSNESKTTPSREADIAKIGSQLIDVLVVGGGIVGAGVARDAAMRGLSTVLVEQRDFASGTSSRSSRLLHGGLRYLAQGRVGLVREASREKRVIGHIAPHLAQPLAFIFPGRKGTSWKLWKLAIGVKVYDALCGMRNFGRSRVFGRKKAVAILPGISTQDLTGAVRYFDALTNDARLVVDTVRSAVEHGATALNYMRLLEATRSGNVWRCTLEDVESNAKVEVQTRAIVNATGPWSDKLPHSNTSLRLTKGVHLVIDRHRLPVPDAVVMAEGDRILFAIPWGERVILGTTDTDYQGALGEPSCDEDDIQYVLGVTNAAFPQAQLTSADLISFWAGLRPLVADQNGNPSDISRRHEVKMNEPGWWDITGGKLTTYRLMAEEAVDAIAKYVGVANQKCQTARRPLLTPSATSGISGIVPPPVSEALVKHFCRNEWALHLEDLMIRRTSWRHYRHDHLEVAASAARWMGAELSWDEARIQSEIATYRTHTGMNGAAMAPHHATANGQARRDGTTSMLGDRMAVGESQNSTI
ncbi:MAG TPA: glycerol-3-phosphate dehydrogenase/oxidase [Lacipirellulaceae bacterium]|nr:glycerol-3-phosphate dehydrogenase/oxidase [Lacipirellulaceae bacterium]